MIVFILAFIGLCLGSFTNAFVWRLHEQEQLETRKHKASAATLKALSITTGRSMCPHCRHTLEGQDLVPVVSWLALKGKCRYCNQPISWQYPLVEIIVCLLFIGSYVVWPFSWDAMGVTLFSFWLVFLIGFMILAIYDLRWYILPDKIVYPIMYLAGLQAVVVSLFFRGGTASIAGAAWGALVLGGLFYILFQVSSGRWIGGGDVKLGVGLGLLVGGPLNSLLLLFIASLAGSLIALPLLAAGKAKQDTRLPFGPMLLFGTVIVSLFGKAILHVYRHRLLGL